MSHTNFMMQLSTSVVMKLVRMLAFKKINEIKVFKVAAQRHFNKNLRAKQKKNEGKRERARA